MEHYLAFVQDKKTKETLVIGMHCEKAEVLYDILCLLYDVRFIATKETFSEEMEKWSNQTVKEIEKTLASWRQQKN